LTGPLLETKFHAPMRRRGVVARPRLTERLDLVRESKLILVAAPAGFGKSTLVTEWMATSADVPTVAWVSLDQRDNSPAVFWTYVLTALQAAAPGVGESALALSRAGEPADAVLATLVNDLHAASNDVVLVLDDYHVIDATEIHDGMAFLLDHLPHPVHVVITSRADPPLPLARLRARGELVELRAADLRFTPDEAATYLTEVMSLELTESDVARLEERTEGWIAALQLAALSMQGRDDASGFIAAFAGDDRYIVDYLVGEVLERQPEPVRAFLLQTSILSRLNGALCDAVTGHAGGTSMLEALDRANLFLVPLDDRRYWYRYHHLFADVLRARLLDEQPATIGELHRRASGWHERHDDRPEAIRHALAGEDFERAADLVEIAGSELRQLRREATLRSWFEALPAEVFENRPVLAIGFVGALMATGELSGVERLLQIGERWMDAAGASGRPPGMVVLDEAGLRSLPSSISLHRAGQARLLGDLPGTMRHAQRVLDLAGEDDLLERGGAACLLGLAHWSEGNLDEAHRRYAAGMATLARAGHDADVIAGAVTLADIRIAQGRLGEAMRHYERGLDGATRPGRPALRGAPDMHVGIAELLRERNDLAGARRHLATARDIGEEAGFGQHPYRWRVATARLRQAEGDLDGAVELLDEAEKVYDTDYSPEVQPVPAVRARVHLAQGRQDEALRWARDRAADDALSYVREYEHITLARILLAGSVAERSADTDAVRLLERLLNAAEEGGRVGSAVEILVLLALAHRDGGRPSAAHTALERALNLAEPEGYARVFLDEGAPMLGLLRDFPARDAAASYAGRLVAAGGPATARAPAGPGLVDPLSERELDVLRLLRSELDGPEIARELTVSLNTMRTHTKNIYAKLGVGSRRAAVRRADELDL
jgi:LuxR family maltose regulon positive regulatory protein